jgi:hypothetical protein
MAIITCVVTRRYDKGGARRPWSHLLLAFPTKISTTNIEQNFSKRNIQAGGDLASHPCRWCVVSFTEPVHSNNTARHYRGPAI